MRWQDIVISVCQVCLSLALLPSVRSKHKPALATSVMNTILITTIATCMLTLRLWFSAITAACIAFTWGVLAVQKIKLDKKITKETVETPS